MTTVDRQGLKIVLDQRGSAKLWDEIFREYAGDDPVRWKKLAMFSLYAQADWTVERIGATFCRHKGQISRIVGGVREEILDLLKQHPEWDVENPFQESANDRSSDRQTPDPPDRPDRTAPAGAVQPSRDVDSGDAWV